MRFSRLPYYGLLLKPLALLPYRVAYAAWLPLSVGALLGFALLWPGHYVWLVCCWFLPAFVGLFNGQDVSFVLFWVALAVWLLRRERSFAAGVVLALCASKYHLMVLIPLVVLAQRRWRMVGGAAAAAFLMAAVSFACQGPDWPRQYYSVLADSRIHPALEHMPALHAFFGTTRAGLWFELAASITLASLVWITARDARSFEWPLGMALAAGVLISFHSYIADCTILLPALIEAIQSSKMKVARVAGIALATALPWLFLQMATPFPGVTRLTLLAFVWGMFLGRRQS